MANKETVLIEFHMKNKGMKEVVINAEKVNMSFKKVKKSGEGVGRGFFDISNKGRFMSNIFSRLRSKLLLVSFALGLITKLTSSLTKKYMEQEKAVKKLEAAVGKNTKGLINQAAALQQVTIFGDEVIINAQALIGAYISDEQHLKAATEATLDLASAKGMDLAAAADLVGKSLGSSTNALSRYGVEVQGVKGSTERVESLTRNVAKLFGGQAAAETRTLTGALEQMKNALGDTNELLGQSVAPFLTDWVKWIKKGAEATADWFAELTQDDMLQAINNIERLGGNADDLRLIYEQTKLDDFFKTLDPEVVAKLRDSTFDLKNEQLELDNLLDTYGNKWKQIGHEIHTVAGEQVSYEELVRRSSQDILEWGDRFLLLGSTFPSMWSHIVEPIAKDATFEEKLAWLDEYTTRVPMGSKSTGERVLRHQQKLAADLALINTEQAKVSKDAAKTQVGAQAELIESYGEMKLILDEIARLQQILFGEDVKVPFFQRVFGALADTDKMGQLKESISEWGNAVVKIATNYQAVGQARLDAAKETELGAANEIKWEKKRQSEIDKINKKYEAEQDALNKKNKRIQRAQTVVNTASGIMGAYADTSSTNMLKKHIMAVFIAMQGAAQLATIDATKYRYGGAVGGRSHSQGGTMIEAERGEFVMRREAVEAVGIETMNRINQGGGAGGINISFNGNVLSKDFIEDEAIPQIKEAIRRGADIGVG